MRTVREMLEQADPLRDEQTIAVAERRLRRQIIAARMQASPTAVDPRQSRRAVLIMGSAAVGAALLLVPRLWNPFVMNVQAAVRFEVRLAENVSGPGLRETKVLGSERSVYLHAESVVTNSDIDRAEVVQGGTPTTFGVVVTLNSVGAAKMRRATANHVGKPIAVILDGQVVIAPTLRTSIADSATINGDYTKDQAERIASGILDR